MTSTTIAFDHADADERNLRVSLAGSALGFLASTTLATLLFIAIAALQQ